MEESDDETPAQTEQLFKGVLRDKLSLESTDNILFRAIHRLPKPRQGQGSTQPKAIIAAFLRHKTEMMLSPKHIC